MSQYQCMFVIPKDRYMSLISQSSSKPASPSTLHPVSIQSALTKSDSPSTLHPVSFQSSSTICPVDGLNFKHPNILAHHKKSHVTGFKCNICAKVFKSETILNNHLAAHKPQVMEETTMHSELTCSQCNKKMKHKHNLARHMKSHENSFSFDVDKWETLT